MGGGLLSGLFKRLAGCSDGASSMAHGVLPADSIKLTMQQENNDERGAPTSTDACVSLGPPPLFSKLPHTAERRHNGSLEPLWSASACQSSPVGVCVGGSSTGSREWLASSAPSGASGPLSASLQTHGSRFSLEASCPLPMAAAQPPAPPRKQHQLRAAGGSGSKLSKLSLQIREELARRADVPEASVATHALLGGSPATNPHSVRHSFAGTATLASLASASGSGDRSYRSGELSVRGDRSYRAGDKSCRGDRSYRSDKSQDKSHRRGDVFCRGSLDPGRGSQDGSHCRGSLDPGAFGPQRAGTAACTVPTSNSAPLRTLVPRFPFPHTTPSPFAAAAGTAEPPGDAPARATAAAAATAEPPASKSGSRLRSLLLALHAAGSTGKGTAGAGASAASVRLRRKSMVTVSVDASYPGFRRAPAPPPSPPSLCTDSTQPASASGPAPPPPPPGPLLVRNVRWYCSMDGIPALGESASSSRRVLHWSPHEGSQTSPYAPSPERRASAAAALAARAAEYEAVAQRDGSLAKLIAKVSAFKDEKRQAAAALTGTASSGQQVRLVGLSLLEDEDRDGDGDDGPVSLE